MLVRTTVPQPQEHVKQVPTAGVCALVMAAGRASRFGSAKQLIPVRGVPLVVRAVRAAHRAGIANVVVALGPASLAARTFLRNESVLVAEVVDPYAPFSTSLQAAAAAAPPGDDLLVMHADQPDVDARVVQRVLEARRPDVDAVRATYGGDPGHPVLLRAHLRRSLTQIDGDRGALQSLQGLAVIAVECEDLATGVDIDTPADLRRFLAPEHAL